MVLQYGPLPTPLRCTSGYEDDVSAGGRASALGDRCTHDSGEYGETMQRTIRFSAATRCCLRRCCRCNEAGRRLAASRWLEDWLVKASTNRAPSQMRDTEAGGRSPGLRWRASVRKDGFSGWGLVQQRGAALIWVALFFSVPLLTFFVGKRYFGDVAAGVCVAVLLQLAVIIYAVCSAQAVAVAESGSPRKNR